MSQQLTLDSVINKDPSARKHGGAETSIEAHERVKPTKEAMYRRIMDLARVRGDYGLTVHEVCGAFGKTPNEVSGRLSELVHKLKWLKKNGEKRNGAAILIVRTN